MSALASNSQAPFFMLWICRLALICNIFLEQTIHFLLSTLLLLRLHEVAL